MYETNESIQLTIRDDGSALREPARSGRTGTGIAGLTERIAALGGTVTACRPDDGGFRLTVDIPQPHSPTKVPASAAVRPASGQSFALGKQA
jgi:two-component system sensor histidine kinase DesK